MSALAPALGMPVAFKLGTRPRRLPAARSSPTPRFRLMGFRFPAPLLGAAASLVFLFLEENPIWGGTIASTLTGEFSYTYGIGLAVLFLGVAYRAYARGWTALDPRGAARRSPRSPTGTRSCGRACPRRTSSTARAGRRGRSAGSPLVGGLAFALSAFWLAAAPLRLGLDDSLRRPLDHRRARATCFPPLLWPLFVAAALGARRRRSRLRRRAGGARPPAPVPAPRRRSSAAALAAAGPALGIIDVRFVPFAQLALVPGRRGRDRPRAGSALAAPDLAALALVGLLASSTATRNSRVLRAWIDWNYTGLEAKEGWPAFRGDDARRCAGGVGDPRVAVEYARRAREGGLHPHVRDAAVLLRAAPRSKASTTRPACSHPSPSTTSPPSSARPRRTRSASATTRAFDPDGARSRHLRLFDVSEVVALSPQLRRAPRRRGRSASGSRACRRTPSSACPATAAATSSRWPSRPCARRRAGGATSRTAGSRASRSRRPAPRLHRRPALHGRGEGRVAGPARRSPLPAGVEAHATVEDETITITTNRVGPSAAGEGLVPPALEGGGRGRPLPRVAGADDDRAAAADRHPHLRAHAGAITLGLAPDRAGALIAGTACHRRWRRLAGSPRAAPGRVAAIPADACDAAAAAAPLGRGGPGRASWSSSSPRALCDAAASRRRSAAPLRDARRAPTRTGRFADAAEYARHALEPAARSAPLRAELLCLRGGEPAARRPGPPGRGDVRGRGGRARPRPVPRAGPLRRTPRPRGGGEAGDARPARERLLRDHADTPWARRALHVARCSRRRSSGLSARLGVAAASRAGARAARRR